MQKLAFKANAINKFYNHLQNCDLHPKRLEGIFLALADLCSKLECCRARFMSLQVLNLLINALTHDEANVRTATCICLKKTVSRSIKNLSAGYFMNERIVIPLARLLSDLCTSVQVAALVAISNIVVDFTPNKSTFIQCGGIKELVHLTKPMDSSLRLNVVWSLRNVIFLADKMCKEAIFMELTASSVASLICDPEPSVQHQALALVRNFVDGCMDCVEFAFAENGIILDAVGRQLKKSSRVEIIIHGIYAVSNIASGNEFHKEAIMQFLFPEEESGSHSFLSAVFAALNDEDPEPWQIQIFCSIDSNSVKRFPEDPSKETDKNLVCGKNALIDMSVVHSILVHHREFLLQETNR
ncbi:uncharacterized protein C26H5.04-like [Lathyrus oleraceus]|uniref:uncharacterized protein C26H5.04-like n=1 Tax=Pisum sativum TaxID=3888 RepID=UPI0021D2DB61|nr:uncharacterized protein C26H5.04-like [Pisum sativum]